MGLIAKPASEVLTRATPILDKCILFQALDEEGRRALAAHAYRRTYVAGEPIFHLGDAGDRMMAVLSGAVRIRAPNRSGRGVVLADVRPGEVFGEIAMLDGGARSADAVAYNNCELLVLEGRDALPFLRQHPQACLNLLVLLCGRVRRSDERMFDFAFLEMRVRLARALLANREEQPHVSGADRVRLNQRELAEIIGAGYAKVRGQMSKWQAAGLLRREKGWTLIERHDALAKIAMGPVDSAD
jgi:CRP-like cAMP-binding protein